MDANHIQQFGDWFDVLAVTHRLQATEDQRTRMKAEYFDVLRSYPVEAIASSYESLRRKMKKWPVPADWLENLPPFGSTARLPPASPEEVAENDEAERLGYEAQAVCTCALCVAADCFLPPRYVPRMYQGEVIERRHPTKQGRPLLLGVWLHGNPLKNWYRARAEYYSLKTRFDEALRLQKNAVLTPEHRMQKLTTAARATIAERTA